MFVLNGVVRHSVVANQGIRQDQNLASIGRIRECFGVSHHARIEDDFAIGSLNGCTERASSNGLGICIGEVEYGRVSLWHRQHLCVRERSRERVFLKRSIGGNLATVSLKGRRVLFQSIGSTQDPSCQSKRERQIGQTHLRVKAVKAILSHFLSSKSSPGVLILVVVLIVWSG